MKLIEMTSPDVHDFARSEAVAVLPLGSVEQHGPHLAVSTDTVLMAAVAERAAEILAHEIVLCPNRGATFS